MATPEEAVSTPRFFFVHSRLLYKLSYILSFTYFSLLIRMLLFVGCKINIYAPHPANIFSNYLFLSGKATAVYVYEDGLLNYYDASSGVFEVRRSLRILAAILGMHYRSYQGHLAGYDATKLTGAFLSHGDLAVCKEKLGTLRELPVTVRRVKPVKNRILFLDQDVSDLLTDSQRTVAMNLMLSRFPMSRYEYIYKGHHDYRRPIPGMALLPEKLRLQPAELIIPDVAPSVVVSFYSSALLNIATLYPEIVCLSLAAELVRIKRDGVPERLSDLLTLTGVRTATLNDHE